LSGSLHQIDDEMAKLRVVVRTIGTPFNNAQGNEMHNFNNLDLYDLARRNKIGLLFLESLARNGTSELEDELIKQRNYFRDLKQTTLRISDILNKTSCVYAIIKSNYSFPAVPNDVDVLIFGSESDYDDAVKVICKNSFEKLDEAPLESCFHDNLRGVRHENPKVKDIFDVDVYKEIGAGHIIYMDKRRLRGQLDHLCLDGQIASVLSPPAELIISIFHSIFPERMFTLLHYYHILHTISSMKQTDREEFIQICNNQKLKAAAGTVLRLTESIHKLCFSDEIPRQLTELNEEFDLKVPTTMDHMPYKYPTKVILKIFWGKRSDLVFSFSVLRQAMSMINPKYAKYVLSVNRERKIRDTY
jgi:hypothetical protein